MATFTEDRVGLGGSSFGSEGLGGGLLLGLLLGRGGLLGNQNDGGCVTPEMLNQQTLGDIKAAIPYNEAQVQLALAGAVASLTTQATADTQYLSTQNVALASQASTNQALLTRDVAAVDTNVDRQSTAIQIAIAADGAKTRELITTNQIAELNQRLTVAQLENAENRSIQREMTNSHNVTTIVNTNQQQQQLQNQEIRFILNSLLGAFGQIAKATNSNVVVGSTGVGTSQTANPTNVNA